MNNILATVQYKLLKMGDPMNSRLLKVEAKSLAAQSKFLRKEELKLQEEGIYPSKLYNERTVKVRKRARIINLARAYIRGLNYSQVEENKSLSQDILLRVKLARILSENINRYIVYEDVDEWMKGAEPLDEEMLERLATRQAIRWKSLGVINEKLLQVDDIFN